MKKKKKNFVYPFIAASIILAGVVLFLIGYKSSVKLNDESMNKIKTELKKNVKYENVVDSTIFIYPHVGSLVYKDLNVDMQKFSFMTKTDSTETRYGGWLILKPKFLGYDIVDVEIEK